MATLNEPIAVIGSGCRFPGGSDRPSKLWQLLQNPRCVASRVPGERFNIDGFYHPDGSHHGTTNVKESYFLEEDHRRFDAQFFSIQPGEAEGMDPQQRVLLETVYEGLESAGLTINQLQGSSTAVYVGLMTGDYNDLLFRDMDTLPKYSATSVARSIMSNRISYFFDWHGPSMTLDTACSSSLVALHHAVQTLRSGESHVAIAAGTNLIIGPEMYVAESKLNMLSPTGRSRMWDADADGYARGDGVASVVLKTLSNAIKDRDHIECIIRETGINQDGRSKGITMPSSEAQSSLIRATYRKSGLDPRDPTQRCQYFEAHGTGTKAGDPLEAQAIAEAFYGDQHVPGNQLYVGSVKTVIGHTEGTAGLAGLLKVSLALKNKVIPPNLLFRRLNPDLEGSYKNLQVPTEALRWPETTGPRRASVNSFGFGGTNAHAIVESYDNVTEQIASSESTAVTPFVFSAQTERALVSMLTSYCELLESNANFCMRDLAWTLYARRSKFGHRASFAGTNAERLCSQIRSRLQATEEGADAIGVRPSLRKPRVLGVFTGQGAQWVSMGRRLIEASAFARSVIDAMEQSLASLPEGDRPSWSLRQELLADASESRMTEAAISQPLCTAIQVLLVEALKISGVKLDAVVGHSSGEIAAAYAAGIISSLDAIRIAYYRGLYAKLAGGSNGQPGAMMAVGTSAADAEEICDLPDFKGRVGIAAFNSNSSLTLSGDKDAIEEVKDVLDDEKKFSRVLKVDTAYHSSHMNRCADPYASSLKQCNITLIEPASNMPVWYSSVNQGRCMSDSADLRDSYWVDNMLKPVLFSSAITSAHSDGKFDVAIELGPHPALKGPATQTLGEISDSDVHYIGLLRRGEDDVEALASSLGDLWCNFDRLNMDLEAFDNTISGGPACKLVKDLPTYAWDHERLFWKESRRSKLMRNRDTPAHSLLGTRQPDGTEGEVRWRNFLQPTDVPWLDDHQLQGQRVFPAAAHVTLALEAIRTLVPMSAMKLIEIEDVKIGRAIPFNDENDEVEILFSLSNIQGSIETSDTITATFRCLSQASKDSENLDERATGRIRVILGEPSIDCLPKRSPATHSLNKVDSDVFYGALEDLGYNYADTFRGMVDLKRKAGIAQGFVTKPSSDAWHSNYMVHPAMLDVAFQAVFACYCAPGDGRLWSLHVPTAIEAIRIDPSMCGTSQSQDLLPFDSTLTSSSTASITGDVYVYGKDSNRAMIEAEGVRVVPLAAPTERDDCLLFSQTIWSVAAPCGELIVGERATAEEHELGLLLERMAFYYLRTLHETFGKDMRHTLEWHYQSLLNFATHTVTKVENGTHPFAKQEWMADSRDVVLAILDRYPTRPDIRLSFAVGEHLPAVLRGETAILQHMTEGDLLDDFYLNALGFPTANKHIAKMVGQLAQKHPHMKFLEIGAGTGGATKRIFNEIWPKLSSYTYTDITPAFFETAQEVFSKSSHRMVFKTLDIEKDPLSQGFEEELYDVVIASNVLHATRSLEETMKNVRRLLKPGGHLLLLEIGHSDESPMRIGFVMSGLPGWWVGKEDGRPLSPGISKETWNQLLKKTGFSGIDAVTPNHDPLAHPLFVLASQAVDSKIATLRAPLATTEEKLNLSSTLIIGSQSARVSNAIEGLSQILASHSQTIEVMADLDDLASRDSPLTARAILVLADLDEPIFQNMTSQRMNALKRLFDCSGTLLWLTQGCRESEPQHNMSVGFGRGLRLEYPSLEFQYLDLDPSIQELDVTLIAEAFLRLQYLHSWQETKTSGDFSMAIEPELAYAQGRYLVPRYVPCQAQNDRYNSARRAIVTDVSVTDRVFVLEQDDCSSPSLAAHALPDIPASDEMVRVFVRYSTQLSVEVAGCGWFFLVMGVTEHHEQVIALSETNASVIDVSQNWTLPLAAAADDDPEPFLLFKCAYHLLVESIFAGHPRNGSSMVVNEPDYLLAEMLTEAAVSYNTDTMLLSSMQNCPDIYRYIHPKASKHHLKKQLPKTTSTFCDLSQTGDEHRFASVLPIHSRIKRKNDLLRKRSEYHCSPTQLLQKLTLSNLSAMSASAKDVLEVVSVKDLYNHIGKSTCPIVSWVDTPTMPVQVQPADSGDLFALDKTYLLIGLTAELGQSLCQWMVAHGARFIVLASRNPDVDQQWLTDLGKLGARVEVIAMDVTSRESILSGYKHICASMPHVAGVVNGAMVLKDVMFANMDMSNLQQVLKPKVDGSRILDEIFSADTLDYFILLSSVACVVGNRGQANYMAANMYMTSLARQRQSRGLAASVIDLSAIVGLGYISRIGSNVLDNIKRTGVLPVSERDFHQVFAEAVLASKPSPTSDPEIIMGLRLARRDDALPVPWLENPKFSHFVLDFDDGPGQDTSRAAVESVKAVIERATTMEDVFAAIQAGFSTKLRAALHMSADDNIDVDAPLIQLGVDSLVAVEIRNWFLKEVEADMPVLKILGGASVSDLIADSITTMPPALLTHINGNQQPASNDAKRGPPSELAAPLSETDTSVPASVIFDNDTMMESRSTSNSNDKLSDSGSSASCIEQELDDVMEKTEKMSFGQSRFWFLKEFLEDQTTFNIVLSARVQGALSVSDFDRAVRVNGQRHESLRTRFFTSPNTMEPTQGILRDGPLRLEHRFVSEEMAFQDVFQEMVHHSFDLASGRAIRVILLTKSATCHFLVIACHHIVMDEVSMQILLSDIEREYQRRHLPPALQYADYSRRQRQRYDSGNMATQIQYWKDELVAPPAPLALLPLSPALAAKSRPLVRRYDFNRYEAKLSMDTTSRIRAMAKSYQATSFHFYVSILRIMLSRLLSIEDLCIGMADANRNDSDTSTSVGFFVNLLPLRFQTALQQSFSEILKSSRNKVFGALAHSDVPFDVIIDQVGATRSPTYTPLFQAFVDYRLGVKETKPFADCQLQREGFVFGRTGYDIALDVVENMGHESSVVFMVQKDLYSEQDAKLMMQSYLHLIEAFVSDSALTVDKVPLFPSLQTKDMSKLGAGPVMTTTWPETVVHRVSTMVSQHGNHVALKDDAHQLTYTEMARRVGSLAAALLERGIANGAVVGVYQLPTVEVTCCMLAIMSIGATYLPLDCRIPMARLNSVVKDSKASAILVHEATERDGLQLESSNVTVIRTSSLSTSKQHLFKPSHQLHGDSPAMILYTSGSTGVPKLITLAHYNIKNAIEAYTKQFDLGAETMLQQSALSFDFSIEQTFTAICNGGTLYVVPQHQRGDPVELTKLIAQEGITVTGATPSEYLSWLRYGSSKVLRQSKWKLAASGGEHFSHMLAAEFSNLDLAGLRVLNIYGPTETSISCTKGEIFYRDVDSTTQIPAGRAIANCSVYIVDKQLQLLPSGIPGEILIGGAGVGAGYSNLSELTRSCFLHNPWATSDERSHGWTTVYRSGDRGVLNADGTLTVLGRMDDDTQVKLRGIRIELEDVASAILSHAKGVLTHAVATIRGSSQVLIAYVVFHNRPETTEERAYLQELQSNLALPQYMRPSRIIAINSMPLTFHGKIDRRAIQELSIADKEVTDTDMTLSNTELKLKDIWREVLDFEFEINRDSDFFHVGGNSLLLMQVQNGIKTMCPVPLRLVDLFQASTLQGMAALIDRTVPSIAAESDWESDTVPPEASELDSHSENRPILHPARTVVLTGSTGFLGKSILQQLLDSDTVDKIHCVAVRNVNKLGDLINSHKMIVHIGDLSMPQLGLSDTDARTIFSEADCIIHNGADVSFLKTYDTLRAANVLSTDQLVRLALPRCIPFHFISSVAVGRVLAGHEFPEISVAADDISVDKLDGYALSKLASERLLERTAAAFGLPVIIHRPTSITGPDAPALDVMSNLVKFSRLLKAVPFSTAWKGYADFIAVESVASGIVEHAGQRFRDGIDPLYAHHCGELVVPMNGFQKYFEQDLGQPVTSMTTVQWAEEAVANGMDPLLGEYLRSIDESSASVTFRRVTSSKTQLLGRRKSYDDDAAALSENPTKRRRVI